MQEQPETRSTGRSFGTSRDFGALRRIFLWVGLAGELVMMAAGLWPAAWLVLRFHRDATHPGHWVLLILGAVMVFNYGYLVALLAFRLVLPRPKEGFYPVRPGRRLPAQAVLWALNLLLVKARFEPPWATMFSSVLANSFPLRRLFARLFGPRSRSMTMGDTVYILDPYLLEIGRNAVLGFHCTIAGHLFNHRGLLLRKVVIGDGAVIGAGAGIPPGVRVGHHAVVATRALVPVGAIIRPYEYWAGTPAKKIKDLTPEEFPAVARAEGSGRAAAVADAPLPEAEPK